MNQIHSNDDEVALFNYKLKNPNISKDELMNLSNLINDRLNESMNLVSKYKKSLILNESIEFKISKIKNLFGRLELIKDFYGFLLNKIFY